MLFIIMEFVPGKTLFHSAHDRAIAADESARIVIRVCQVIAQRDIQPWEAVTFDYNTTEWEMAEPFDCGCGSANCLGAIRGLKYLTLLERERLGKVAPHLSRQLAQESRIPAGISQA